ncbi:sigma-70 family RNA polymerase sigma factor [Endozoicomonas sp. OPT23]|uniref:sigma-70 family RNA polymerase sigma factor n=1 Tax=Endozoicomonas sp. OPT23 TaxID=2072845 RepID=UPI001E40C742|nr:sigma-70 family RNA polymerase sigma factor [Endozoicomonas sp. OPT23]
MASNLVDLARYRSRSQFLVIYDFFAPRLKSYLIMRGAESSLAEELVQEAMLSVWRRCDSFDPEKATASTWIFTIARNLWIDHLRKFKPDRLSSLDCYEDISEPVETEFTDSHKLKQLIKNLPCQQAQLIHQVYFSGKTHREIADEMAIPLGSVKSGLRLAFEKLRKQLGGNQ